MRCPLVKKCVGLLSEQVIDKIINHVSVLVDQLHHDCTKTNGEIITKTLIPDLFCLGFLRENSGLVCNVSLCFFLNVHTLIYVGLYESFNNHNNPES